ncbi:MAG: heme o synthase, partial [Vulcanococcus sp.]
EGRRQRTSGRALPSGRLSITTAFAIAVTLTLTAATLLVGGVNCLAASLSLLGLCSYVLLYTVLLKPRTTQNIVIGGVAGAIPPLVGAAAATGHLGLGSWWLFALVMLWTPAHFWALALLLKEDYRAVGIPMLPVVKGSGATAEAIRWYALATVVLSLVGVWALPGGGLLYGLLLLPFNARLLQMTWNLHKDPDDLQRAKGLFRWSIFYLFGVCLLLLMARMPAGEQFSQQGFALLGWSGSGNAGFTLVASLVSGAF